MIIAFKNRDAMIIYDHCHVTVNITMSDSVRGCLCDPAQITLCYYDVKDALSISPEHTEAMKLMGLLQSRAQTLKTQAVQLNLMGRTREALQKISIAQITTYRRLSMRHVYHCLCLRSQVTRKHNCPT